MKRLSREVRKSVWRPPHCTTLCPGCSSLKAPVSCSISSINSSFTMALLLHYRKRTRDRSKVKMWVHSFQNSEEFQASERGKPGVGPSGLGVQGGLCLSPHSLLWCILGGSGPKCGATDKREHQYPGTKTANRKRVYNQGSDVLPLDNLKGGHPAGKR